MHVCDHCKQPGEQEQMTPMLIKLKGLEWWCATCHPHEEDAEEEAVLRSMPNEWVAYERCAGCGGRFDVEEMEVILLGLFSSGKAYTVYACYACLESDNGGLGGKAQGRTRWWNELVSWILAGLFLLVGVGLTTLLVVLSPPWQWITFLALLVWMGLYGLMAYRYGRRSTFRAELLSSLVDCGDEEREVQE